VVVTASNKGRQRQEIVRLKYVKQTPICLIPHRMHDSPLWKDLMKVRHIYLRAREYKLNNGMSISFWLDKWLDDKPLCASYPIMYDLCPNQKAFVHEVVVAGWVVRFETRLQGIVRDQWYELTSKLNRVSLNHDKDVAIWKWNKSRKFTVRSVYEHLIRSDVGLTYSKVWRARIHEKNQCLHVVSGAEGHSD
jgi:hypothetical protein